jgi:cyclopropane-fatty-acyl-phospholipid synthase
LIKDGSIGLGESYMDSWWEVKDIEMFFSKLLKHNVHEALMKILSADTLFDLIKVKLSKTPVDPYNVARAHYDIGNDLYSVMLGKAMAYSCGYWQKGDDLDAAQEHKFELICKKLHLKAGMTVIDIGCGWGGLLVYMAKNYGVKAVGLTVSVEQKKLIEEKYADVDITVHLKDYQEFAEISTDKFDRIVSVGMFEHVGLKNYKTFMEKCDQLLKDDGLFLLHTIGSNENDDTKEPWMDKYIFPDGKLPGPVQIIGATEDIFVLEDWHNFGINYNKTLCAWEKNFVANWPGELETKYGERFYRMWRYYLLSCAGAFSSNHLGLWQLVLSKGLPEVYEGVR